MNVYVAEPTAVLNAEPSVLVCTDRVWVRVPQAVDGGSFSVTLPMLYVRAEVDLQPLRERVVGALPVGVGVAVGRRGWPSGSPLTWLLAVAGRPSAMLVLVPMPLPDSAIEVGLLLALLVMVTRAGPGARRGRGERHGHRAGRADRERWSSCWSG